MRSFRASAALAAVLLVGGAGAASACQAELDAFERALAARALPEIVAAAQAVDVSSCPGEARRQVDRRAALAHVAAAVRAVRAGAPEADQEPLYLAGLKFGDPWQITTALAGLREKQQRFAEATELYQRALNDLAAPESAADQVPPQTVRSLVALASQTRMLAPETQAAKTRTGEPGALQRPTLRGVRIERVPLPILFPSGSDRMTELGVARARELLDMVLRENPPEIIVVGHTDPIGDDAYNLDLSLRRARAVGAFLLANGYSGRVIARGMGEREPLTIENAASYSTAQIHQMQRRVEYVRSGS